MSDRAPYSRVYWSIQHDEKFDGIREDMRLVGAWLTLLVIADQTWPAPAYPPPIVPKSSMKALVDAGLIDPMTGGRYKVHGLDSERQRRSRRDPDASQQVPNRVATGYTDKQSKEENEQSTAQAPRDAADIYWQLTGRFPVDKALTWIDSLAEQYGSEPVITAMASAFVNDRSVQTLLGRTRDALAADARKLDKLERVDEQRRLAEKRAQPRVEEPWKVEFRESIARQYEALEKTA